MGLRSLQRWPIIRRHPKIIWLKTQYTPLKNEWGPVYGEATNCSPGNRGISDSRRYYCTNRLNRPRLPVHPHRHPKNPRTRGKGNGQGECWEYWEGGSRILLGGGGAGWGESTEVDVVVNWVFWTITLRVWRDFLIDFFINFEIYVLIIGWILRINYWDI